MEDGEIDLFNSNTPSLSFNNPGFSYYNMLESCDSSQDSRRNNPHFQLPFDKLDKNEESKKSCFQVNISDIGSVDSRSTVKRRPRSSSQPTESNDRMIKEPFVTPQKKNNKRVETMSNCSNLKLKPSFSVDGCSVDGGNCKLPEILAINLPCNSRAERRKKNKLKKYPNLLKNAKKNKKNKKKPFKIYNIDEIVNELNSIPSPALYCDLLYKTLREKNKTLLRNVVDEIGMSDCTQLLREVALIQENGGMKVQDGGSRMKTLGGVFFYLIRTNGSLPKEAKDRIFKPEKKYLKAKKNIANDLEKLLLL